MKVKDPDLLRRWRKQERYSQAALGAMVRRSQQTIHLLESGKMRTCSEALALALAGYMRRPWEDLFDLEEGEILSKVANGVQAMSNVEKVSA